MQIKNLIKNKQKQLETLSYIEFSDAEIKELSQSDKKKIISAFHGQALLKIPDSEVAFFEWVKKEDFTVWNDLWGDFPEREYQVSMDFLEYFGGAQNGFPICDLEEAENYFFTLEHIKPEGRNAMPAIVEKNDARKQLDIDELLLFELHLAPIDIWHFAYRYKLPLNTAKQMISDMVYKSWIVHLTERDDLLKYITF